MVFEWECEKCGEQNNTDMDKWVLVRDGQGFVARCTACETEMGVDVHISTEEYVRERQIRRKR